MIHLVVGGNGFIGSNLVEKLMELGERVVVVDKSATKQSSIQLEKFHEGPYSQILGDINILEIQNLVQEKIGTENAVIWHLAANSDIKSGSQNVELDFRDTFLTTLSIIKLSKKFPTNHIIFSSTSAVYGLLIDGQSFKEDDPCNPISFYGASKLASENFLSIECQITGIPLSIMRFANIIGAPATHGLIHDLAVCLQNGDRVLRILGDGNQRKPYLHVTNLISMLIHTWKTTIVGTFNLCPPSGSTSVREIAETMSSHTSFEPDLEYETSTQGWFGDVPTVLLDDRKFTKFYFEEVLGSRDAILRAIPEVFDQFGIEYLTHDK